MPIYPRITQKEEEIMRALWYLKKAFVKEIKSYLQQDLHYNTISTLIRNLEEKKFVGYHVFGNTHQYYPLISQKEYQRYIIQQTTDKFFGGSYQNLVTFFAKEEKISQKDLEDILKQIQNN